uniref:E3 ubiquitin-protein ligase n=1 Tax=Eptatretus burgeri TaxID=7764 RepID=A0A8C4QL67_EPTBU
MAHGGGGAWHSNQNEIQPELSVLLSPVVLSNVSKETLEDIIFKENLAFHETRNGYQIDGTFEHVVSAFNMILMKKRVVPLYFEQCKQIPRLCHSVVLYMKYVEEGKWNTIEKTCNVTLKLSPSSGKNEASLDIYPHDSSSQVLEAEEEFTRAYWALIDKSIKNVEIELSSSNDVSLKSVYLQIEKRHPKVLLVEDVSKITLIGCEQEVKNAEFMFTELMKGKGSSRNSGMQQNEKVPANDKDEQCETCAICLQGYTDKMQLDKCKHSFCKACINEAFKVKKTCPICNIAYGIVRGTQPHGTMNFTFKKDEHLPGFDRSGIIEIAYNIPSAIQGNDHPHPGCPFIGTRRTAYLPLNKEGRHVLDLLKKAFDQKLIFTVGMSRTTGADNTVTWNDIHHKTQKYGGPQCFGYPDPDYLNRVQEELKAKGIY